MQTVLERADARIADSIHQMSRASAAVADAIDEGIDVAKRVGKRSSDAAEDMIDDTTHRIKRHPVESLAGAFVLGLFAGGAIAFLFRRK